MALISSWVTRAAPHRFPTETIAAIKSYRQYSLSSLVVPPNLGKTGFPEPTYQIPSPPTILLNSFGNSLAKKSRIFCASGVPAAYSMPA